MGFSVLVRARMACSSWEEMAKSQSKPHLYDRHGALPCPASTETVCQDARWIYTVIFSSSLPKPARIVHTCSSDLVSRMQAGHVACPWVCVGVASADDQPSVDMGGCESDMHTDKKVERIVGHRKHASIRLPDCVAAQRTTSLVGAFSLF